MGWTGQRAIFYKNGKIDRKAECDYILNSENETTLWEVVKSSMRGSTYYAAVKVTDKETGKFEIFAAVFLTSINNRDYFNFNYKDMDETCGPCERDCPLSILDLLTETESKWANEWRRDCRENHEKRKKTSGLGKRPIGAVIEIIVNGKPCHFQKMKPNHQFKTTWWYNAETNKYMSKKYIKEFKVVENLI